MNGVKVNRCMVREVRALLVSSTNKALKKSFQFVFFRNVKSRRKEKSTSLHCTMYAWIKLVE